MVRLGVKTSTVLCSIKAHKLKQNYQQMFVSLMHLLVGGGRDLEKKAQLTVLLTHTDETSVVQTVARSNRGRMEPY